MISATKICLKQAVFGQNGQKWPKMCIVQRETGAIPPKSIT